jgi:allophanate hydrolase subunit 2
LLSLFEILKPAASMVTQRVPMDPYARIVLGRILGHPLDQWPTKVPQIWECTLTGPVIRVTAPMIIAIAAPEGAMKWPVWEPVFMPGGSEIDLRNVGGSSWGGSSRIYFATRPASENPGCHRLRPGSVLRARKSDVIDLAWSDDEVTLSGLTGQSFRISPATDRRGIRCQATEKLAGGREIPPEPMTYGAIQLPPSGDPVIVGPDGPITGGYRRVGTVSFGSLRNLAWLAPGDRVQFREISREDALKQVARLEEALVRDLVPC